jgi:hypothetical protein
MGHLLKSDLGKDIWKVFRPHFVALLKGVIASQRAFSGFAAVPVCYDLLYYQDGR